LSINHLYKPDKQLFMTDETILQELKDMEDDAVMDTKPRSVMQSQTESYLISFAEFHARYLKKNPKLNAAGYIANLRTQHRIRTN
jgi:hypothetical protein